MSELVPFSRRFHWDLLLPILQLSDTPTLAALGAVSYDLLVASSLLLYRDVTVTSVDSLQRLFCEREETKTSTPSRINPLLSLSQLQTLHVDFSSQVWYPPQPLFTSRIDHLPLPLDLLRLSFSSDLMVGFPHLYSSLFPEVNPLQVAYEVARTRTPTSGGPRFHVPRVQGLPLLDTWTRTEAVVLRNVVLLQHSPTGFHLAFIPPPFSVAQRRVVRVHLDVVVPPVWIQKLAMFSHTFAQESMKEGFIALVMRDEKEKKEVEAVIGQIEPESARRNFAVEVED